MANHFEYHSMNKLVLKDGVRHAYLGDMPDPVLYGQQGKLREHYNVPGNVTPRAATLDHIVAAVGGWLFGTFAGALAARKVKFNRDTFTASVDGTIEGPDNQTIRITKIHIDFTVDIPAGTRDTAERSLRVYPAGCPAHESIKDAIAVTHSASFTEV